MAHAAGGSRRGPISTHTMMEEILCNPRFDIPYFGHEPLDPLLYPGKIGKPIAPVPEYPDLESIANRALSESSAEPESVSEEERRIEANINISLNRQAGPAAGPTAPEQSNEPSARPSKRTKVEGFRPAVSKKVVADMDSDDELLWNLKLAKWTEKEIHARFIAEGRIGYCQKTIGTRFCRMKKVMTSHTDKLLEEGKDDWHEGDDAALFKAVQKADEQINKILQQIEKKKWQLVAEHVKEMKPVTNYSGKACRQRWEAHMQGSASVPLERREKPDEQTLRMIKARQEQEARIRELELTPR